MAPKTDLRVRSKMAKSRFFCYFSCCGPSGACPMTQTFHTESSYSIGIFSWTIFFRLTFLQKIFALENFRKFRLKKFSTNEIRDMEVQQRAKFSLTKPHHIVLKSTATSYLCGSFKKMTILRSFSQGKKQGQKWPYWKAYDMSTIFSCFEELYDGVLWTKTWRATAPPYPRFRWSKIFSSEIFENFQAQKFFRGRWVKNIFFRQKVPIE